MYLRSLSVFLFTFSALLHFVSAMIEKPEYILNIIADVLFFIGSICAFIWTAIYTQTENIVLLGIILLMGNGMQILIICNMIQHIKEMKAWEAECNFLRKKWENL